MKKYDFVIVGAGLFGATFAYEAAKRGAKCLILERRNHIGGNCYTEKIRDINVHKYGAHIFHTSDKNIWHYINQFAEFNNFINSPMANFQGKFYNLPFNMNTFYQLWGVTTPAEAQYEIEKQRKKYSKIQIPRNLEEQALLLVGKDIYEKLIRGYSEKQWGMKASEIPAFVIKRLPLRFKFDNNYFNDSYQGIPIGGYTPIFEKMLSTVEVKLNTNFFDQYAFYLKNAGKVVYTGPIDELFNYRYGPLAYRSLTFNEVIKYNCSNYQGNAVINYTDGNVPYTRTIEHKHFEFGSQKDSVLTFEYPSKWIPGKEAYYPVNDDANNTLYRKYSDLAASIPNLILGGRLAEYKYYDMDKTIEKVLSLFERNFI